MPPNIREKPRLSINQLATYLGASPAKRRRVLQDAKRPPVYQANWYDASRRIIVDFISTGMNDESMLTQAISGMRQVEPVNEYEESRLKTNAEALESVLGSYDQLEIDDLVPVAAPGSAPRLTVGGVEISVRPEISLSGNYRRQPVGGAVKLYLSKQDAINNEVAAYLATVLRQHVAAYGVVGEATPRNASCLVYDVFAGRVFNAPTSVTRRNRDIEAACQEIAAIWPTV